MYPFLFLLTTLACTSALPLASEPGKISSSTIYQFPQPNRWFENLVVRADGKILATELTRPNLWLIDPTQECNSTYSNIELVSEFPEYLGLLGIVEYKANAFAFIAGNFSIADGFVSTPGSYAVWSVEFVSDEAKITKIADIADAEFLNGMAYLPSDDSLLLGDAGLGQVWKLDLTTGLSTIAITDPLMKKVSADAPDGINGLKVYGDELWFTRGFDAVVAKTRIYGNGTAVKEATVMGYGLNSTWTMDDLVVDSRGRAYVAIPFQNAIARYHGLRPPVVVAGNINSTEIAEPTSIAFARTSGGKPDERALYVATGGAIADPIDGKTIIGGQIVKLQYE